MSLTLTVVKRSDLGSAQMVVADAAFDSSYPKGGEAIKGTDLGMRAGILDWILVEARSGLACRFVPNADGRSGTLKLMRALLRNAIVTAPGLAIGTGSKAKILIANTVVFTIASVFKSKTTAEVAFTATTMDIAASGSAVQEAVYVLSIKGDGTVTITMGTIATGAGKAVVPQAPNAEAVLGYVRIAVAAGVTKFDASTDFLDAGHLTVTYVDALATPHGAAGTEPAEEDQTEVADTTDMTGHTVRFVAFGR